MAVKSTAEKHAADITTSSSGGLRGGGLAEGGGGAGDGGAAVAARVGHGLQASDANEFRYRSEALCL